MIKTKGERVSPREIENALCTLSGVAEAAVYGVPDELMGEAVKASIVRREGAVLEEKQVFKHCADLLEPFLIPKFVEFVEELPRTPNGKVDKRLLQKMHGPVEAAPSRRRLAGSPFERDEPAGRQK